MRQKQWWKYEKRHFKLVKTVAENFELFQRKIK